MLYPDFDELVGLGRKVLQPPGLDAKPVRAAASGDYASPFRGPGLEFDEVRHYLPGDDVRYIDWRVTARTGTPHLKLFTQERERTVMLCIEVSAALAFGTRGTFKSIQAARAAAMLGWHASGNNDRVGAVVYGDVPEGLRLFRPSRSRRALWRTLKLLSSREFPYPGQPATLSRGLTALDKIAPTGSLIFLIGGFDPLPEEFEKHVARLQRRLDIVPVRVNDPGDGHIPAMGIMNFIGANGARLRVDTDSKAGRELYARAYRENRELLQTIALRRALCIIDLHTDGDVHADLSAGLRRVRLKRAGR